ncbi:hypothetical protein MAR_002290 [Mya arenaria]|uniref:Uncharacterized protein n=1 Tax=Mya arenaria TaxID=6604 RepID=A0ABY7FE97_MYAAR|nr:hypothetical protein MAR_002290 [Mya arenaria]
MIKPLIAWIYDGYNTPARDQTETASVCQQPDRAQPLQPLQAISGPVVRDHIAMQDPPPYELSGANYFSEQSKSGQIL